eukprot:TRINITY_DN16050_c0_g1_i1.p1 TRINITY_DN16050_c0_g1~~TRINITY_DN16050_c0_g1_i1.p1  ORF type:complete len:377 (-),score=139.92 TRINITY_DN16050_c0_g1_i1:90-1220(-)
MLPKSKKKTPGEAKPPVKMGPQPNKDDTDAEIEKIKAEIEMEQKSKGTIEWTNMELERSVRMMERNVLAMESGSHETDDSDAKQKYEGQKQLNTQLLEQKRWLEHELEEIKLKIQNDKSHPLPDMLLDWDSLSETELKRLVGQLEKTRNDLKGDIREVEFRLDKEGKDFHHFEDFAKMYRAEVKSLTRTLDQLQKHGATIGVPLPGLPGNPMKDPQNGARDNLNSESHTPGGWFPGSYPISRKHSELISGSTSPPPGRKMTSSPSPPPIRRNKKSSKSSSPPPTRKSSDHNPTTKIDPKLGAPRKTAGVRNLPKIEKGKKKERQRKESGGDNGKADIQGESPQQNGDLELEQQGGSRKSANSSVKDLDPVEEEADN